MKVNRNTKAFIVGVLVIVLGILIFLLYRRQQPLEPAGSLTNIEISPTSKSEPVISTPPGLP